VSAVQLIVPIPVDQAALTMEIEDQKLSLKRYWSLLADYLAPQKGSAVLLGFLVLSNIALQLINPQVVRYFLDTAESGKTLDGLVRAAAVFMGIALLNQVIKLSATYLGENVAWRATNALRADLALHCLKLDMSFHKKYKPGELIERVDGDVNQLANFFSQLVLRLGGNLLLILGVMVLLFLLDWRLGLWTGLAAVVGLVALNWLNKRTVPRWQAVREADAQLFGYVEEWLNGTEEIRTNAAELYVMRRMYESLRQRWQKILAAMRFQVLVADLPLGVFAIAYAGAYIASNIFFKNGAMTIGQIFLIFYYIEIVKGPLWEILHQIEDLQRASASINRIVDLRAVQPSLMDGPGASFPEGPLGVRFQNVTFHYEDDEETNVLEEVEFDLPPGTVMGLLGRTGSGKSTLTKLIFRFFDPAEGQIMLGSNGHKPTTISMTAGAELEGREDGNGHELYGGRVPSVDGKGGGYVDIRQARQAELRQRIGMVTQDVQIFHASVRQNISLFDDSIPDERVLAAVEEVGLSEWLAKLPDGLDTRLEGGGSGMSAGEAQLLAFARVLLEDPGLVILDEASSRLDYATEQRIERAVGRLMRNRTGIIIAHRLSTVGRADRIMILDGGRVAEYGQRLALADDPKSLFARLLQTGLEEAMA